MTKSNTCLFATIPCLVPENIYGCLQKITGNGLAAGCQLFYRKIYGYFCSVLKCSKGMEMYTCISKCDTSSDWSR